MKHLLLTFLLLFLLFPASAFAAPPTGAVKFTILQPSNSTVGTPVTVTVQAQKTNSTVDTAYENDVTLVTSGSATGGGLVDIVNGVGTLSINDSIAETITLSLSDTQATGLDVSSTKDVTFASLGGGAVWNQIKFWFRDDDGGEATATGYSVGDAGQNANITGVAPGANFRLRFQIKVTDADSTISPRLEFKEGTDCTTGDWTAITPSSASMSLNVSPNFDDGATTTQQLTGGSNFAAGQILESTNPASSLSLLQNKSTEYEWSLKVSESAPLGTTYSLRITNNGTGLNTYEQCPSLAMQSPPPAPSSGGGGGVRPTMVRFSGRAYPGSKLEVLRRSAIDEIYRNVPETSYTISESGEFQATFVALLGGDYFFALRAEDKDGRKTGIWSFTVNLLSQNELVAEHLLVPPTIGFLRGAVRKGDPLTVMGYATPLSSIEIELDGWPHDAEIKAGEGGFYKILIPTAELPFGAHTIRSRQKDADGKASEFSTKRVFMVSKLFVPKTDLNNDDKINISDWSIFLSRWESDKGGARESIDLNDDGKIDISDFSIFIRTIKR